MQANRSTVNWYQTVYRGVFFAFRKSDQEDYHEKIRKLLLATLAAALCALLLTGCGEKEVSVSVTLVNHSGHDISSISITPSTSTEWDTEL